MRTTCALLVVAAWCGLTRALAQQQPPTEAASPPPGPLPLSALLAPLSSFPLPTSGPTFLCENWGSHRRDLPTSFVADGVCDCCDGSDELVKDNPFFPAAASSAIASPCANTCASEASAFLLSFEAKVSSYARSVEHKAQLLNGLPALNDLLNADLQATHGRFEAAVKVYHGRKAHHDATQTQQTYNALQMAGEAAGLLQWQSEQLQWMLGHPVAHPRNRSVQRPPGSFGAEREWLLLYDRCFDYAWPQRRFGAFGEHVDWYLMELCPLQNATQVAMTKPPPREGSRWREAPESGDASPVLAKDIPGNTAASESEEEEQEEPQQYVLGLWTGELLSVALQAERRRLAQAAAEDEEPPATVEEPVVPEAGSTLATTVEPEYFASLRGGQECWQIGPRQADLRLQCGEAEEIVAIRENGKCKYEFVLQTPLACDKDHLAAMEQQLVDYVAWFERPEPEHVPTQTREQLHDEL